MRTFLRTLVLATLVACAPATAQSGSAFVYQGRLEQGGVPGSGAIELEFRLFAQETGGVRVATFAPLAPVAVVDGVFVTPVDFGAVFDGRDFFVELGVRPAGSAAAFTTLAPRQPIKPAPGAQYAQFAAVTGPDSVASGSIVDGSIGAADVDATQVQRRSAQLAAACAGPEASIKTIAPDGSVTCETDDAGASGGGDVTAVAAGTGLAGGGTSGDVLLAIANDGVGPAQIAASAVGTSEIADASVAVSDAAPESFFVFGGNTHASAAPVVFGTTQNTTVLDFRVGGVTALRLLREGADSASVVGGAAANTIGDGALNVTIAGGGYGGAGTLHRVSEADAVVGGGIAHVVSDGNPDPRSAAGATIAGGSSNRAAGAHASIAGGSGNVASGAESMVAGGTANCAGGDRSFAGGSVARVRPATGASKACNFPTPSSGDANGDEGTFIWADATFSDFISTGPNQFLARASGGVAFADSTLPPGVPAAGTFVVDMPTGVAINRTTAQATLHVSDGPKGGSTVPNANAAIAFENDGDAYIHALTPLADESGILFGTSVAPIAAGIVFNSGVPNGLDFRTGGNNARMVIDAQGDVGMRNAAPEVPLHIGDIGATAGQTEDLVIEDSSSSVVSLVSDGFGLLISGPPSQPSRYGIGFDRLDGGVDIFAGGSAGFIRAVFWDGTPQVSLLRETRPDASGTPKALQVGTGVQDGNGAFLSTVGVWTNASSRTFKEGFAAIDPRDVLARVVALPVTRWRYRGARDDGEHIGPVAEEFRDAFDLGGDGRYIGTVDADGVALAAIQGLHAKLEAALASRDREIEALRAELAELRGGR